MAEFGRFGDLAVELGDDFVAVAEIRRAPNNFFDQALIASLADAFEALDAEPRCRAAVLASEGKHFCAGANFATRGRASARSATTSTTRRCACSRRARPWWRRSRARAIGGGLGLALWPDFRVAAPDARFSANFARLGFHHGFGLSRDAAARRRSAARARAALHGRADRRRARARDRPVRPARAARARARRGARVRGRDRRVGPARDRLDPRDAARRARRGDPRRHATASAPSRSASSTPPTSRRASPRWRSAARRCFRGASTRDLRETRRCVPCADAEIAAGR